jgi:Tol biopolymer transport system component
MEGGLFLYDIETGKKIAVKTEKNMSRKKMNHYNKYYTYSNDGKIVFYLSKDQKSILKYDIRSKRESTVYSGTIEGLYFKVSNDNSTIAFGHWYDNKNELYSVSTSGGNKKKIFEADCDCSPIPISWSKDDKFLYYQEGKFRNLKKIMRVAVNGGEPEEVYTFKDTFENAQIIQVDLHPDGNSMLIQVAVGKAGAIWKLEGLFNQ